MRLRWPWSTDNDLERRDSSYTDALVSAITANAGGQTTAFPTATAALEACAGLVGRSFAAAEVSGPDRSIEALTPGPAEHDRADAHTQGRDRPLHRDCRRHDPTGTRIRSRRRRRQRSVDLDLPREPGRSGETADIQERHWRARLSICSNAADNESPWRGVGPLQVTQLAGRLSAETVAALADESSGPRGSNCLPLPSNEGTTDLQADLKKLKGIAGTGPRAETGAARLEAARLDGRSYGSDRIRRTPW